MTGKAVMSREGYEKLLKELAYLKSTKRKEVADMLERARAHGDLRENAEYDAAKQAKSHLEGQIARLEERLANAKVVDKGEVDESKAFLGATLKLKNHSTGDTVIYTLVSQDEADFDKGHISVTSPIGKGLLGKALLEIAEIRVPAGVIKLEVLHISYS
jgi:transcription elongation factor GreA